MFYHFARFIFFFKRIYSLKLWWLLYVLSEYHGMIKILQSRETGNIVYTRRRQTKQKHNTICVRHNYMQTNTNNVNKTLLLKKHPTPYIFWNVRDSSMFFQNIMAWLKSCSERASSGDNSYSTNNTVINQKFSIW